jgi:hypothetical protein
MHRNLSLSFAAAIAAFSAIPGAAGPLPKEGRYDVTTCWSGVSIELKHSKDYGGTTYEMMGTVLSNPPGGAFDKDSFRCIGMSMSLGGKRSNTTLCEAVDLEGDKRVRLLTLVDGKTRAEHLNGTGKYEGIVISGEVEQFGRFPTAKPGTFQGCNRQTGTYGFK